MSAWYNEIDPLAAATMRELIVEGVIAPGEVDERDIRDISPSELAGFTQCHFFAGGGVWSYALRRAGWKDDWPIWTGSCPCQPFSTAGKGAGFDDERHLWPSWQWLIEQCGPEFVAGEQVADKGADPWIDLVQADLEGMGYAFGCVPLASAGFGAPNPRHRAYWLAYADCKGLEGRLRLPECGDQWTAGPNGLAGWLGNTHGGGRISGLTTCTPAGSGKTAFAAGSIGRLADAAHVGHEWAGSARDWRHGFTDDSDPFGLADTVCAGRAERWAIAGNRQAAGCGEHGNGAPGPVNGFWRDADWLYCRDPGGPRWRPVDSGTFPLAPGAPARVGTLRISGNAINAETATGFIEAVIEHFGERTAA